MRSAALSLHSHHGWAHACVTWPAGQLTKWPVGGVGRNSLTNNQRPCHVTCNLHVLCDRNAVSVRARNSSDHCHPGIHGWLLLVPCPRYYHHVYGGLQPWPNQTVGAEAQGRASVHPEGSPTSQAFSAASSEDECDGQVSSMHNNYSIYPEI